MVGKSHRDKICKIHLVLQFANGIRSGVTEFLNILFHRGDHGRRPADEEFAVAIVRVAEVLFNVIFGDKTNATVPGRWGVIEDEIDLEAVGMKLGKLFQILPEKDIIIVHIGVNEVDISRVGGVAEDSTDDLKHGGNTSSASNHVYMFAETRGIDKVALGTLEAHSVANFKRIHGARNIAFFVGLG